MTLSELQTIAEIALPAMTVVALAGTGTVGYLLGGQHVLRLRRVVARQDQSIQALEEQLSEADAIVRRVTGGTNEIIAAARGAHRREAA